MTSFNPGPAPYGTPNEYRGEPRTNRPIGLDPFFTDGRATYLDDLAPQLRKAYGGRYLKTRVENVSPKIDLEDPEFISSTVKNLNKDIADHGKYQSFAGTDIKAYMYIPGGKSKEFSTLQTISISSTRSISPVRTLGKSNPVTYNRGARTIAGTLVFATINKDVFADIYTKYHAELAVNSSSSIVSDQLPPFTIVLTGCNEKGATVTQIIYNITLVNYGTTYSIDDLYTETTYTYLATDMTTLLGSQIDRGALLAEDDADRRARHYKSIMDKAMSDPPETEIFGSRPADIQAAQRQTYKNATQWSTSSGATRLDLNTPQVAPRRQRYRPLMP